MSYKGSIFYKYHKANDNTDKLQCGKDSTGAWKNNSGIMCPDVNKVECDSNYIKSMCANQSISDQLYTITGPYNGEDERYANTMSMYNTEVLNAFNLGIGVMLGAFFLYQV
jgi:hypothetical protein